MKKYIIRLILVVFGIVSSIGLMAQPPMPPSNQGTSGNQSPGNPAGGAPIGTGTGILLILATGYGIKKLHDLRKKPAED